MFGLTVLTAFVMSAVAASAASAAEFFHEAEAEAGETTARVVAKNEGSHNFTAGIVGTIECKKATFTGTSFVTSPQTTATVTPKYEECKFLGVTGVKVVTHKCAYRFNQPTGTGPFTGTVNVVNCPKSEPIEFEANSCKINVFEQGPLSTVKYTNLATTPKSVKIEASVSNIEFEAFGIGCAAVGLLKTGSYSGTAIADAETALGQLVGGFIK
jgi:hypothetical protein